MGYFLHCNGNSEVCTLRFNAEYVFSTKTGEIDESIGDVFIFNGWCNIKHC